MIKNNAEWLQTFQGLKIIKSNKTLSDQTTIYLFDMIDGVMGHVEYDLVHMLDKNGGVDRVDMVVYQSGADTVIGLSVANSIKTLSAKECLAISASRSAFSSVGWYFHPISQEVIKGKNSIIYMDILIPEDPRVDILEKLIKIAGGRVDTRIVTVINASGWHEFSSDSGIKRVISLIDIPRPMIRKEVLV